VCSSLRNSSNASACKGRRSDIESDSSTGGVATPELLLVRPDGLLGSDSEEPDATGISHGVPLLKADGSAVAQRRFWTSWIFAPSAMSACTGVDAEALAKSGSGKDVSHEPLASGVMAGAMGVCGASIFGAKIPAAIALPSSES
jgi:hypothetical protein